jgi:hypothetical protein
MPRLTGHLQPRRTWSNWDSNILIIYPILWIWPHQTTSWSLDWKKTIKKSPFFVWCGGHCSRGDLVERTTIWIFFVWLPKVTATG